MNICDYTIIVENGDAFRVYSTNKENVSVILSSACKNYAKTKNSEYKNYWDEIYDYITNDKYEVIENTDFCGVRKII